MEHFPWTYDQHQRYSVLEELLKVFYSEKTPAVLDVGGISPDRKGQRQWLPIQRILSDNAYVIDLQHCPAKGFVQGDGLDLPFKTERFDVVSALDVIEHIPSGLRQRFLEELARVSRSVVVLSAPFKENLLEKVERILFEQIERIYGAEHKQLLEHKKHGLPDVETIESGLSLYFPSQADFAFGSLQNWLYSQSLKNLYLFNSKTDAIQSVIDRWMVSGDQKEEFIPPFSRHFWIASKSLSPQELEDGTVVIKNNLLKKSRKKPDIEELKGWIDDMTLLRTERKVTALVFCFGGEETIRECLDHLLTQKVDFELEVAAVDLSPGKSAGPFIQERFPMVRTFSPKHDEGFSSLITRLTARLRGDDFLWISDDILLPENTASKLRFHLKKTSSPSILIPRVDWNGKNFCSWGRGKLSSAHRRRLYRILDGRLQKKSCEISAETSGWAFSECYFFPREALFERDISIQSLTRENIFLWSSVQPVGSFIHCPDILVHRKEPGRGVQ